MSEAAPAERARMIAIEILTRSAVVHDPDVGSELAQVVEDMRISGAQADAAVDLANAVMESGPLIGDVWLHDDGKGHLAVWVEVDGKWRNAIKETSRPTNHISHAVNSENAREWPLVRAETRNSLKDIAKKGGGGFYVGSRKRSGP